MVDGQEYSVDSARAASERDELDAWVAQFLSSPGSDNAPLAEQLSDPPRSWLGPLQLPLDRLHRLAGPPDAPVMRPVDEDFWDESVEEMERCIREGWEPPPVIVSFRDGQLVLEDGNHRIESLRRAGKDQTWAVVSFQDPEERDCFTATSAA